MGPGWTRANINCVRICTFSRHFGGHLGFKKMPVKQNFQVYVVFLHTRLKFEPNCFIHNGLMTSTVFRAILAAILDFERRYTKMLKGARVASNGFWIRTSESTDFNKKTLSIRQVQVQLLLHLPSARLDWRIHESWVYTGSYVADNATASAF